MTKEEACKFVMPLGQYLGKTLEDIALVERDVKYLDWLVDQNTRPDVLTALRCFLNIPWVKDLVERAVRHHGYHVRTEPVENLKTPKPWWDKS